MKIPYHLFLFVTIMLSAPIALAQLAANPDVLEGSTSYTYKSINDINLRLHIFEPSSGEVAQAKPAIVFFFGGGWRQGSVTQFLPHSQYLSSQGMVAIVADYRVMNRHGSNVLAAIADAKSAIRWVRSHAMELNIDPDRIAAAGGSAGGHLAVATSVVLNFDEPTEDKNISSQPNALVLFNPAVNTKEIGERNPERFGNRGEQASPLHQLRDRSVPTIIFHGKADTTVPFSHAVEYCEKLEQLGGNCTLFGYEDAEHGFFNKGRSNDRWYTPTLAETHKFLSRLAYLQ